MHYALGVEDNESIVSNAAIPDVATDGQFDREERTRNAEVQWHAGKCIIALKAKLGT